MMCCKIHSSVSSEEHEMLFKKYFSISFLTQTEYMEVSRLKQGAEAHFHLHPKWVFPGNTVMTTVTIRFSWLPLETEL